MTENAIEDIYPQSSIQEAMLQETVRAPGSGVNIIQLVWTLTGAMNIFAFTQSWQQIVTRHPILRTRFVKTRQNKALQVVRAGIGAPSLYSDWRGFAESVQQALLDRFLKEDSRHGIELAKSPPMRLCLVRVSDADYWFVWTIHHLALDRWSLAIIVQELFAFYEAFRNGSTQRLEPAKSYGDYAAWLQKQDPGESEAFWREQLCGFKTPTQLDWALKPAKGRDGNQQGSGLMAVDQITLPATATEKIGLLTRNNRLALSTLVQAAWALLLSQYAGSSDIAFGTVVSGRSVPFSGISNIVGPFLNVLPMRLQVEADEFLLAWLHQVQDRQMAISQHEHCPLVQVHGWSEIPDGTHIFWSMVDVVNYASRSFPSDLASGLKTTAHRSVENVGMPISFLVYPGPQLKLEISYNDRLLDSLTVREALAKLSQLLAAMAETPHAHISELLKLVFEDQMDFTSVS